MVSKDDDDEKGAKLQRRSRQQSIRSMLCVGVCIVVGLACFFYPRQGPPDVPAREQQRQQLLAVEPRQQEEQQQLLLPQVVSPAIRFHNDKQEHFLKLQELTKTFDAVEHEVRAIKQTGVIMETDAKSLEATGRLQEAARALCKERFGDFGSRPYRIQIQLEYQDPGLQTDDPNKHATFFIETAPLEWIPYSVYNFLEVARGYQSGGFHRRAGHVLQATTKSYLRQQPLAFQEYSKQYPHVQGTVGYCGRPSGHNGCWYISTMDNTQNHGPGSQQKKNTYEADANFGRVVNDDGSYDALVRRIRESMKVDGFLNNPKDWVLVTSMEIMIPDEDNSGKFKKWDGYTSESVDVA
jgi:hypothetical protein